MRTSSTVNGPASNEPASGSTSISSTERSSPCSSSFDFTSPSVKRVPKIFGTGTSRSR